MSAQNAKYIYLDHDIRGKSAIVIGYDKPIRFYVRFVELTQFRFTFVLNSRPNALTFIFRIFNLFSSLLGEHISSSICTQLNRCAMLHTHSRTCGVPIGATIYYVPIVRLTANGFDFVFFILCFVFFEEKRFMEPLIVDNS